MAISMGILSQIEFSLARDISYCHKLKENTLTFETTYFERLDIIDTDSDYYRRTRNKLSNYNVALIGLAETQEKLLLRLNEYLESELK
jgi:hypothetical protein